MISVWIPMAALLQEPPPTLDWRLIAMTRNFYRNGHVRGMPPPLEKLEGKWVTFGGFAVVFRLGTQIREVVIADQQFDPVRSVGRPPDPFNSVRVVFRNPPAGLESGKYLQVSGILRFLKQGRLEKKGEDQREVLVRLWHITDAVEGNVPDPTSPPPPPGRSSFSFALLEQARAPNGGIAVPSSLRELEGSWVTLTGNVLVPWATDEISSFALAKNPWDGCCMGVPPTIFDSIQVKMAKPLSNRYSRTATVSGRFRIREEHLPTGYPAGLFHLEEAVEGVHPDPNPKRLPAAPAESGSFPWFVFVAVALAAAGIVKWGRRRIAAHS